MSLTEEIMDKTDVEVQRVFRDSINCHRGDYFVTYTPAIWCRPHATISLTFLNSDCGQNSIKNMMEQELEFWLKKYPVPAMVTSFDTKEDIVYASDNPNESHLVGFIDTQSGQVNKFWRLLKNEELPAEQMEENYLAEVYKEIPFRRQADVQTKAYREAKATGRAVRLFMFFVVGVPVLIEIVSLGVEWIGYLLSIISIAIGLYKFGKAMGWIRPSKREMEKAGTELKMSHCYYHCEKNPDAFNRLKVENFERETIENTLREEKKIRKNAKN